MSTKPVAELFSRLVENHARMIREKWRLRQLISTCQRVTAEGYAGCDDVQAFKKRRFQ